MRPARCPGCDSAGRPVGRALGLVGHGLRRRQVRGPLGPGEPAAIATIGLRRYRCRRCRAVLTVLPRGLVARRHYAAAAMGLSLLMLGLVGSSFGVVRRRLSPWPLTFETPGWATPRRWLRAIEAGELFPCIRASPPAWSVRRRAERAAMTLLAMAPPSMCGATDEARVIAGAARAA